MASGDNKQTTERHQITSNTKILPCCLQILHSYADIYYIDLNVYFIAYNLKSNTKCILQSYKYKVGGLVLAFKEYAAR